MSDLICNWVRDEVGVACGGRDAIEADFANGFLFGKLLHHFNLQPDIDKFEDRRAPESMVNNYTRLQPTFTRLNIPFDTRVANALMREEPGVALRLLYSIKQTMTQIKNDLEKYKKSGRLGRELGASLSPNRTLLDSWNYRTPRQPYQEGTQRFFEDVMRSHIPDTSNHLMETMHMRKYQERQYRLEAKARAGAEADQEKVTAKRDALRSSLHEKMATNRTSKATQLQHDAAVHATLLKHKEEVEKEELRVELALAETHKQKRLEELHHAALDVTHGIDTFEINMKRLLKGDDKGEEALMPATSHTSLEHQAKLRAMATSTTKLLEETSGYMAGVRAQGAEDVATKREREARRRRMLVEQQATAAEAERRAEAEALLSALARQSMQEQQLAERLWQLGQEQEVMRENRLLREQQYAARRAQDWDDTLKREFELHRSLRQQYEAAAAAEKDAWIASERARKEAKSAKHRAMCENMAWQLVQLAERCVEYRQSTGGLVPRNEWRRWCAMFVDSNPQLGEPVVKRQKTSNQQAESQLAKAAVADWLDCLGEYECQPPIGHNEALGAVLAELDSVARPKVAPSDLPQIQHLPLKICIVGTPFGGKTGMAKDLAQRFRLRLLEPEGLVAEAIQAADDWAAGIRPGSTPEEPAPNAAASPQSVDKKKAVAESPGKGGEAGKASESSSQGQQQQGEGQGQEGAQPQEQTPQEPEVPQKVALGQQLKALLQEGKEVPDDVLVPLMVLGMEESANYAPPVEVDPKAKRPKRSPKGAKGAPPPEDPVPVPQGFVVDGFPRTEAQAIALERALTGLDLRAEQAVVEEASRIAPPPTEALPQVQRTLVSGLDAVIVLEVADFTIALKRALGRRLDPLTGRVYHLEFDPPPANDPGLVARLRELDDRSNDAVAMQQRLMAHAAMAKPMDEWHKRFSRLRRPIDGSGPQEEVLQVAADAAQGVLRAKAAVASCRAAVEAAVKARAAAERAQEFAELARTHAEAAAQELLTAKKAEIQAAALLEGTSDGASLTGQVSASEQRRKEKKDKNAPPPDPVAVEVLKAQAAAKCAEQFKVCRIAAGDASNYAERAREASEAAKAAVERARSSLGDAEISAGAQVEAKDAANTAEGARSAAAEAASKAEVSKAAAEVAAKEAEKFSTVDSLPPDAKVELSPQGGAAEPPAGAEQPKDAAAQPGQPAAPQPAKRADIPSMVADAMIKEWRVIEHMYLEGCALGFANIAEQHMLAVVHFDTLKQQFKALLARPDKRVQMVTQFQKEFNAVDVDARRLRETQAELVLRAEELREALWGLCDAKMEGAEGERARAAADSFVQDHSSILGHYYASLAQVELDRFYATLAFLRSYTTTKYGVLQPRPRTPLTPGGTDTRTRGGAGGGPSGASASAAAAAAAAVGDDKGATGAVAPDLLSGTVPPEFRDRLDDKGEKGKSASSFPPAVASLSSKCAHLCTAIKVALAAGSAMVASLQPEPEPDVKGPKGRQAGAANKQRGNTAQRRQREAKGSKTGNEGTEGAEDAVTQEVEDAITSELLALGTREAAILEARMLLLADRAGGALDGLAALAARTHEAMGNWVRSRFKAECSAVAALEKEIRTAALAGTQLPHDLHLVDDGTVAVVDEGTLVVPPHPGFPLPQPVERQPPANILSVAQLGKLASSLVSLAPKGFLKLHEFAELLLRAAGDGTLPDGWRSASARALLGALRLFDPTETGYADWREVLVCLIGAAFPIVLQASCADMADQCEMLREADKDKDGLLLESEWLAVELWFQYRAFQPGSSDDLEAEHSLERQAAKKEAYDRAGELKKVIWQAFKCTAPEGSPIVGQPALDFRSTMLYLCSDRDLFMGIKKAFSVATHNIAGNVRATAQQIHHVAYPFGPEAGAPLHKAPMDLPAISEVVQKVYKSRGGAPDAEPAISAEQLMYSAAGERVVTHLLASRYQWQDVFTATKML